MPLRLGRYAIDGGSLTYDLITDVVRSDPRVLFNFPIEATIDGTTVTLSTSLVNPATMDVLL